MKQYIIIFFSLSLTINSHANVNFIDFNKISKEEKLVSAFSYIKDYKQFFDHWTPKWEFSTPKQEFIDNLRNNYNIFSSIENKSTETYLLLGDISHHLYNLDDTTYYSKAVNNYNAAVEKCPNDYRCYWFLGHHYALSNVPEKAIENFKKAQALLADNQNSDFWEDYAWAATVTNMPSHCIFAMDKAKDILGNKGRVETQLGQTIRDKISPVDKNKFYKKEELWSATKGEKVTFVSRPLGIKIAIDSTWNVSIYDFQKGQSAFIINPPALENKKGKKINYTIGLIVKTVNDNANLDEYLNTLVEKNSTKTEIAFTDKYDKTTAFEIIDKTMYQNIGGGHLIIVGIERTAPKYPGLLLESPLTLPQGKTNEVNYYRVFNCKDRFKGKIFYAFLLDSCEDISNQSQEIFKQLLNNQIIIE